MLILLIANPRLGEAWPTWLQENPAAVLRMPTGCKSARWIVPAENDHGAGSFPAVAIVENEEIVAIKAAALQNAHFFPRPGKWNVVRFDRGSGIDQLCPIGEGWSANSSIDRPSAQRAKVRRVNNGHLFQGSDSFSPLDLPQSSYRVWVNPVVAVVNPLESPTEADTRILDYCLSNCDTWLDVVGTSQDELRDRVFEELTQQLLKRESQCESRARSVVECMIWGPQRQSDEHRAFLGLDSLLGRFWIPSFGRPEQGPKLIRWSALRRKSTVSSRFAAHWCKTLQVGLEADDESRIWSVHREVPYAGYGNFEMDWTTIPPTDGSSAEISKLVELLHGHSELSTAGRFLTDRLTALGGASVTNLPPEVLAWQTYLRPRADLQRLNYGEFIEGVLRSFFIRSEVRILYPSFQTRLDKFVATRSRLKVRASAFQARFSGRAIDLARTRVYGRSATLHRLLQPRRLNLFWRPPDEYEIVIDFSGEWWKTWEDAIFNAPARTMIYFNAPEEGPFYLGVSRWGDILGQAPCQQAVGDQPNWPSEIYA